MGIVSRTISSVNSWRFEYLWHNVMWFEEGIPYRLTSFYPFVVDIDHTSSTFPFPAFVSNFNRSCKFKLGSVLEHHHNMRYMDASMSRLIPSSATSERGWPTSANTRVSDGMNCTVTFSIALGVFCWKRPKAIFTLVVARRYEHAFGIAVKHLATARRETNRAIRRVRIALVKWWIVPGLLPRWYSIVWCIHIIVTSYIHHRLLLYAPVYTL